MRPGRFLVVLGFMATLSFIASPRLIADEQAKSDQKPKVVALLFYADWCGSCKILDPRIDEVRAQLADQPVYFTRVDLTDDQSKAQSQLFVNWVGLREIYEQHAPKTGFMLLIDVDQKKVLNRLTREHDEQEIRQAVDEALATTRS